MEITHDISIVGYGVKHGTKYWVVRNSRGTTWGENGFAKIIRGVNNLNIESECSWATPKDTWTSNEKHVTSELEKHDPRNIDHDNKKQNHQNLFLKNKATIGCSV